MTIKEAIKEITSKPKYYIGIMPQSTASAIIKRHREGTVKKKTLDKFLEAFGYELEGEEQWKSKTS